MDIVTRLTLVTWILYACTSADGICPDKPLLVTWLDMPPYAHTPSPISSTQDTPTNPEQQPSPADAYPEGALADTLQHALRHCCGERLTLNVTEVSSIERLYSQIMEADITMPLSRTPGFESTDALVPGFHFIPVISSPGSVFLTLTNEDDNEVPNAVLGCWPLLLLVVSSSFIAGIFIWMLDTTQNPDEFPRPFFQGFWEGIWWSFVTMTTVGYGDKAPRSVAGRLLSLIWMVAGIVLMSVLTASLASALQADPGFHIKDVRDAEVGVILDSNEAEIVFAYGGHPKAYSSSYALMDALMTDDVDTVLMDSLTAVTAVEDNGGQSVIDVSDLAHHPAVYGLTLHHVDEDLRTCMAQFMLTNNRLAAKSLVHASRKMMQNAFKTHKTVSEVSATLMGPLYLLLYVLAGLWAVLMLACITWELARRKRSNNIMNVSNSGKELTATSHAVLS